MTATARNPDIGEPPTAGEEAAAGGEERGEGAAGGRGSEERPRRRWRRLRRWVRRGLLIVGVPALALIAYQAATWPDVARLRQEDPESTAFIDDYRREAGRDPDWRWVPYGRISPHLKKAVLVSEDLEFFSHDGFSLGEIRQALEDTLERGQRLRGASTLTQQTAKNLYLSPSRNPWRKVKEAVLTIELERRLTKRRILEIYLNVAAFGPGIYGAEAAAQRYFGVPAAELTPRQAAALAAALPSPSRWHPGRAQEGEVSPVPQRTARIERRMAQAGWLDGFL